jgi:transposase-like protein
MSIRRELIDELLKDYPNPQDVLAEDGLLKQLSKAVIERCLETELDTHLGYAKHGRHGNATGNTRNGTSQKTLKGEQGQIELEVPRDRQGSGSAAAGEKRPDAARGLRRENPEHVRAWHDHPRHPGPVARTGRAWRSRRP